MPTWHVPWIDSFPQALANLTLSEKEVEAVANLYQAHEKNPLDLNLPRSFISGAKADRHGWSTETLFEDFDQVWVYEAGGVSVLAGLNLQAQTVTWLALWRQSRDQDPP